jgi:hypothetical protein
MEHQPPKFRGLAVGVADMKAKPVRSQEATRRKFGNFSPRDRPSSNPSRGLSAADRPHLD